MTPRARQQKQRPARTARRLEPAIQGTAATHAPPDVEPLRDADAPLRLRAAALPGAQQALGNAAVARELTKAQGQMAVRQQAMPQPASTASVQRGFFKKLWGGVKKVASAVGSGVKAVGGAIASGAKKVAGAVAKVASKVWTGATWVGQQLWTKVTGVFHRIGHFFKRLPARLGRLFTHLWEGVKQLQPWSLKWWGSLFQVSTWEGVLAWLGTSLILVLEAAGVGEVYETLADWVKFNTRGLTGDEIAKAKRVFGSSIDYALVRVDSGAVLGPSWTDQAYVSFHTINAWGPLDDHTLIHELTHVWQYGAMGAIYMPRALHAQKSGGYSYGGLSELRKRQVAGQGFHSFNLEQQGQITGDYYIALTNGGLTAADKATYEFFIKTVRQ